MSQDDKKLSSIDGEDIERIIEMAWEDRTSFDAIASQFGISESQVIKLMRRKLSSSGFLRWRKRVAGRKTKHHALRSKEVSRHHSSWQRKLHRP